MPTERMEEVEVVACEAHAEDPEGRTPRCVECGREEWEHETPYIAKMTVAPGSLTSARLRLADAAEAYLASGHKTPDVTLSEALSNLSMASHALDLAGQAVAALRTARGEG